MGPGGWCASASYLMAVQSWSEASPYILATGQEVMPLGGFSVSVPEPTLSHVKQLVHGGQLRFFLLGSGFGLGPGRSGNSGSQAQQVARWVESACTQVPAQNYGGTAAGQSSEGPGGGSVTMYECARTAS